VPFVLIISNEPDDPVMSDDDTQRQIRNDQIEKVRAAVDRGEPVTEILTPVTATINTRSAQGALGIDELRTALSGAVPKCDLHVVKVRMWPQLLGKSDGSRAVSTSWRLSPPSNVTCISRPRVRPTKNQNGDRLTAVWNAMKMTSSCGKS
jgi:hypothetical protein